jgi:Cu-Zn family superoxide dismutase
MGSAPPPTTATRAGGASSINAAGGPAGAPATAARATTAGSNASTEAHVVLKPASDSDVHGELALTTTGEGVRIKGRIRGLKPDSTHGFHIHEHGDCSAPDASSAGGHFNPTDQRHGRAGQGPHHAGDMDNVHANDQGVADVDVVDRDVQLGTGSDTDAMGKAIIVHADPDDYKSQPSGDAGARIACGVIR